MLSIPVETKSITELSNFIAETIAAIGGLGTVTVLTAKFALPRIRKYYAMVKQLREIIENLPAFMQTSENVSKELTHNGGSSIKDAIARIETMVAQNSAKHQAIWKHSSVPMFYASADGDITEVNSSVISLLKRDDSQLLGMNWLNSVAQAERSRVSDEWNHAVKQERNIEIECTINSDGRLKNVIMVAEPLFASNALISYAGSIKLKGEYNGSTH